MDKYEYQLKLDQLKNLVAVGDYETAAEIANTINWRKVRNSKTLLMVAEVYEALEQYEPCKEVLLQAYDHSSIGRNIVSRLAEVAIKAKNVTEAEEFYSEFLEIAPKDNQRYVIAYKISCLKDAPLTDRIAILEELKEREYTEMWAYELAALYGQAGMREKCVETCDELILWFGEGEYVEKALDLKRGFQPLTPAQEKKFQRFRSKKGMVEISVPNKVEAKVSEESGLPEITVSKFNTQNLQDELAKSMKQIMEATEKETVSDTMDNIKKIVSDIPYLQGNSEEEAPVFNPEQISEEVDRELQTDFQELLEEESDGQTGKQSFGNAVGEQQVPGQMSIEEVLAEWEKTKHAAEAAIAAAEQKKLDMAKEQALTEANEIMERLQSLLPLLSATPGEDIPDTPDTVASKLVPAEGEREAVDGHMAEAVDQSVENRGEPEEITEAAESAAEPGSMEAPASGYPTGEAVLHDGANQQEDGNRQENADVNASGTKTMPDLSGYERTVSPVVGDAESMEMSGESQEDALLQGILASSALEMPENGDMELPGGDMVQEDVPELAQAYEQEEPLPDETTGSLDGDSPEADNDFWGDSINVDDLPEEEGILTAEEREMFSYFLPVPGMEEQILTVLENAPKDIGHSITSLRGNLIVQGEEGSGKTVLATSLIKAIQRIVGKEDSKIGKISAEALNRKNFAALVPKIQGGFLIVDKAGDLTAETAAQMSRVMGQNTQGMVVVLEDDSAGIKRALSLDRSFAKKFTGKVKIPIFTIDELVDFGKSYATEMECVIEEMGVLALYNRINNIQKLDRATTLSEVKEIVDQAIESAEGGGLKKLFSKKYDNNDYLILREKDFEQM